MSRVPSTLGHYLPSEKRKESNVMVSIAFSVILTKMNPDAYTWATKMPLPRGCGRNRS